MESVNVIIWLLALEFKFKLFRGKSQIFLSTKKKITITEVAGACKNT